ncbi:zinc ABC transporter substrate-binding protein AdcA [Streptococcus lutetiensis]|uniref:zinc ABC transporter substrate-binding protein AdcA n=1 Tax=Streptococcus lutetiensis TaxID=150055 RepID=UPI000E4EAA27|nr:zinc ABC transporter substrate-binding protein AdcA [Streptococcus lutetiensis]RHF40300.1 zinc ABC transporter substrate-binding protein AdcA [Streptococcus lutetiensis]
MKKKFLLLINVLALLLVWQVSHIKQVAADDKIKVVTTFYPVYEFTKAVMGDTANVSMLIKAGTEPHDFEPSTKNVATISDADMFVYMDDSMETWVKKVKKSINSDNLTIVRASGDMLLMAGTAEEEGEDHDEHEGHSHEYDPHVWLSPKRAVTLVENIRDAFVAKYPDKADTFKANSAAYIEKLNDLDKAYTDGLSNAKQKSFVTQHAAFGYLALDYGLNQISIAGISPEVEPSAKRIASLTKYVKKYDIKYIYFEENASSKVAATLADEAGVKTKVLNPLESLTNKQIKAGEDYFSVMKENLKALKLTTDVKGKEIKAETDDTKTVQHGYFKDKDVTDRKLSDWTGKWQSAYPYLLDGTLDPVWAYKAKASKGEQTAQEVKDYYTKGYQTDVEQIIIDGKKNKVTFVQNGEKHTYTYKYVGYKILKYEKGNRGVRYLFETDDKDAGEFKYIQFSDHNITSTDVEHFHLFWGNSSQDEILKEMEHWPTYFLAKESGQEIAQHLVAH